MCSDSSWKGAWSSPLGEGCGIEAISDRVERARSPLGGGCSDAIISVGAERARSRQNPGRHMAGRTLRAAFTHARLARS